VPLVCPALKANISLLPPAGSAVNLNIPYASAVAVSTSPKYIDLLNVAFPPVLASRVSMVTSDEPEVPLNIISSLLPCASIVRLPSLVIRLLAVPSAPVRFKGELICRFVSFS
jgi:hypothetical protein